LQDRTRDKDGTGAYLSTGPAASDDDSADYRKCKRLHSDRPEYLTVFAGDTGKELATVNYPVQRGVVNDWGDGYGNRLDRYNGGMAFVSDTGTGQDRDRTAEHHPAAWVLHASDGVRVQLAAGALTKMWTFDQQ